MSNNKPEAPIPEEFQKWVEEMIYYSHRWDNMTGKEALKAMAEASFRHLSPQPSPGLRWVKCVERMPQKDGQYPIRFIATEEKKIGHFGRNNIMFTDDNLSINKDYWEWLEETPSAQPIEGEHKGFYCYEHDHGVPDEKCISQCEDCGGKPEAQTIADSKEVPEEIQKWIEQQNDILYKSTPYHDWGSGMRLMGAAMYHKMQESIKELIDQTFDYNRLYVEKVNDLAAKETQIAGLLESNKTWGEKYAESSRQIDGLQKDLSSAIDTILNNRKEFDAVRREADDYRKELIELLLYLEQEGYTQRVAWIKETLNKYLSSPIDKDNG